MDIFWNHTFSIEYYAALVDHGTTYDIITFLISIIQKHEYFLNEIRYFKKEKASILPYFERPSN